MHSQRAQWFIFITLYILYVWRIMWDVYEHPELSSKQKLYLSKRLLCLLLIEGPLISLSLTLVYQKSPSMGEFNHSTPRVEQPWVAMEQLFQEILWGQVSEYRHTLTFKFRVHFQYWWPVWSGSEWWWRVTGTVGCVDRCGLCPSTCVRILILGLAVTQSQLKDLARWSQEQDLAIRGK